MKNLVLIVFLLLLVACGKEEKSNGELSSGEQILQGTWKTQCINDDRGSFRAILTFSQKLFVSWNEDFAGANCQGEFVYQNEYNGSFEVLGKDTRSDVPANAQLINFIFKGKPSFNIFVTDGQSLQVGSTLNNEDRDEETRPKSLANYNYKKQ